jgi:hypothetical protein
MTDSSEARSYLRSSMQEFLLRLINAYNRGDEPSLKLAERELASLPRILTQLSMQEVAETFLKQLQSLERLQLSEGELQILGALFQHSPLETDELKDELGTSMLGENSVLYTCRHLYTKNLLARDLFLDSGLSYWSLNDTGRLVCRLRKLNPARAR